jgi:DNA-binding XRE family transcriptional regulator
MSIKEARNILGYTQAQVAQHVGISMSNYFMIEKYRQTPDVCIALKIAHVLNRDPYELFDCTKYKARKRRPPIPLDDMTQERRNELVNRVNARIRENT